MRCSTEWSRAHEPRPARAGPRRSPAPRRCGPRRTGGTAVPGWRTGSRIGRSAGRACDRRRTQRVAARCRTSMVRKSGRHRHRAVLPEFASWRAALHDSAAVAVPPVDDATATTRNVPLVLDPQGRLYLRRYFEYERCLARTLIARAHQRRLELITGGPGTGKTHGVLQRLVELAWAAHAQSRSLRIALAAPTGKAAARLAESVRTQREALDLPGPVAAMIPHQAQTLHRLLGLSPVAARAGF